MKKINNKCVIRNLSPTSFETSCGREFEMNLLSNKAWKFCPYCGKPIYGVKSK